MSEEPQDGGYVLTTNQEHRELHWLPAGKVSPLTVVDSNAVVWLSEINAFRQVEEDHLVDADESDTEGHRAALSGLIAEGENLLLLAKEQKMCAFPSGFTLKDLEASLESLHISFLCAHGKKAPETTDAAIERLFDAA